jgi:hypothetical protein
LWPLYSIDLTNGKTLGKPTIDSTKTRIFEQVAYASNRVIVGYTDCTSRERAQWHRAGIQSEYGR